MALLCDMRTCSTQEWHSEFLITWFSYHLLPSLACLVPSMSAMQKYRWFHGTALSLHHPCPSETPTCHPMSWLSANSFLMFLKPAAGAFSEKSSLISAGWVNHLFLCAPIVACLCNIIYHIELHICICKSVFQYELRLNSAKSSRKSQIVRA